MSSRSTARGLATARVTLAFVFGVLAVAPAHQSQVAAQTAGPAGRWGSDEDWTATHDG